MGHRILAVDDSEPVLDILKDFLGHSGFDVVTTSNAREALIMISNDDFSILITDWIMPGMDGPTLLKTIAEKFPDKFVYKILLTSKSNSRDLVEGIEFGADTYLMKPFNFDELLANVKAGVRIVELERKLMKERNEKDILYRQLRNDTIAAGKVQKRLLPAADLAFPGLELAHTFKPRGDLAGDIYNIFWADENHIALYLADVSGHGVAASLISVMIMEFIHSLNFLSPSDNRGRKNILLKPNIVAKQMNLKFCLNLEDHRYFTMIYGVYDLMSQSLTFISAGHPGLILMKNGAAPTIEKSISPPLGVIFNEDFPTRTIQLERGDRFFIYSDGLTDAMRVHTFFGEERLCSTIFETRKISIKESLAEIMRIISEWVGHDDIRDDMSIIGIEVNP